MDLRDLKKIVQKGESETVEFKKSTAQLRRAGETLCAMLNGRGGRVLIGITPEGKMIGQQVSDKTQRDIAEELAKFEPSSRIEIERIEVKPGREVVVLSARPNAETMPCVFAGRPYQRVGSTTSPMPQETYQRLLMDRSHGRSRWENQPTEKYGLADLDREEILRTVRLGIEVGRLPEATGGNIPDILDRLGLRQGKRLLNAAVVLFGTLFLPDYPQCQLRLARFRGTTKSEFIDNRQFYGHAFHLLDEAMTFIMRHLPIAGHFRTGRLERVDEPLFPVAALREALVNAFCHRDYTITGGSVGVAIFDDRLEIWSDGTLPFGLKVEDLKRNHRSLPRNPLIADTFFRRRLVERWGRGTQMIIELCVKAGHPEPEFMEESGAFCVRFLPSGYIAPHRVAHDLTERQREILQVLSQQPSMPLREIRARMKDPPSDRRMREELLHLKRLGLISSEGYGRGSNWSLEGSHKE